MHTTCIRHAYDDKHEHRNVVPRTVHITILSRTIDLPLCVRVLFLFGRAQRLALATSVVCVVVRCVKWSGLSSVVLYLSGRIVTT